MVHLNGRDARNQIELVMFSGDHRFGMDMKLNSMLIDNAEAAFSWCKIIDS